VCSVGILNGTVKAVSRWDGGLGGELAVIVDLRSIASLQVFGRGFAQIGGPFFLGGELFVSFFSWSSLTTSHSFIS